MPTAQQDTEITLGTGRMLALFFAFVLVCAFFFAIGFSLGQKNRHGGVARLCRQRFQRSSLDHRSAFGGKEQRSRSQRRSRAISAFTKP